MAWENGIPGVQSAIYLDGMRDGGGPSAGWPVSPDEWRERARASLAEGPWGYLEGGAGGEETMRANREAFARRRLRPRVLRGVEGRDLSVVVHGRRLPVPVLLGPVGVQGVMHPDGEAPAARAAAACGVPFVLSTVSSLPLEAVAEAMGASPRWFQLYQGRNRDVTASMLRRAAAAGYEALVVTVDTVMLGWRERDLRHAYLPFLRAKGLANYFTDPAFRALLARSPEEDPEAAVRTWLGVYVNPGLGWEDIDFVRRLWQGPLWLKGITHPDDARLALEHGVDGIIVSNHGGRQVDGAVAALDALAPVADAVGGRAEILFDSGIRRGADVLKALALGARAVLIGRLYQYGLAVGGEQGVRRVLDHLAADLDVTLGLCGLVRAADAGAGLVEPPAASGGSRR